GLHPQAIVTFGLLVLELLIRKYRVVVSTHSPIILDLVWAIRQLQGVRQDRALPALKRIFGLHQLSPQIKDVLVAALNAEYRVYFFDRTASGVQARDISTLDPGDDDEAVAGWGGLSGFSGRIAQIVGEALPAESA
ncbi:MAG TPA: hypothetical protein VJT73_15690, partial [Polyangiaceae bacterium]|nr:hypothetical protein [Polyangiaceae bacterium]